MLLYLNALWGKGREGISIHFTCPIYEIKYGFVALIISLLFAEARSDRITTIWDSFTKIILVMYSFLAHWNNNIGILTTLNLVTFVMSQIKLIFLEHVAQTIIIFLNNFFSFQKKNYFYTENRTYFCFRALQP